jgi:hypothetical protein
MDDNENRVIPLLVEMYRITEENARLRAQLEEPNLGLATTAQLLEELRVRIEVDYYSGGGGLDYSTVRGRPDAALSNKGGDDT